MPSKWRAAAEDDRRDVEAELVDQAAGDALADHIASAHDEDVRVAGRRARPVDGAAQPVGDEGEVEAESNAPGDRVGDDEERWGP